MFIKIKKCSDSKYWYCDHIGKEFEVFKVDEEHGAYMVDNIDGNFKMMGNVFFNDCEEVETINSENAFIPVRAKTDEELVIENLKAEKDAEILDLQLAMAEMMEAKDSEMLSLQLAIAELVEGGIV